MFPEELLNNFSAQSGSWRHCFYFLMHTRNEYVMMYALSVFEVKYETHLWFYCVAPPSLPPSHPSPLSLPYSSFPFLPLFFSFFSRSLCIWTYLWCALYDYGISLILLFHLSTPLLLSQFFFGYLSSLLLSFLIFLSFHLSFLTIFPFSLSFLSYHVITLDFLYGSLPLEYLSIPSHSLSPFVLFICGNCSLCQIWFVYIFLFSLSTLFFISLSYLIFPRVSGLLPYYLLSLSSLSLV